VHDSAVWLTVYVWPAIVRVAVRAAPVFAATVTVTVPEPVPLVGLTDAHVDVLSAVQPHEAPLAETVTVLVPPVAVTVHDVADNP
jgi:hypothetical protein